MGLTFNLGRVSPSVFTDSSLNVGIGAAPSGTYKFEVTGTAKVSSTLLLGGALSGTSATFSSGLEINSSVANIVALTMSANSTGGVRQRFLNQAGSGVYNFQIGSNITTNNAFEIIPSTAADGTTFSTAVFKILNTGAATFSSTVQTGGNISVIATDPIYITKSTNSASGSTLSRIISYGTHQPSSTYYPATYIDSIKEDTLYATKLMLKTTDTSGNVINALTLASTGAATFINTLKYTGTGNILEASSGNTSYIFQYLVNTGGGTYFGIERSTGGGLFTNSSAYATVLGSTTATSLQFATNGIVRQTIDSTGAATFTTTQTTGSALTINVDAGSGTPTGLKISAGVAGIGSAAKLLQIINSAGDNLFNVQKGGFVCVNSTRATAALVVDANLNTLTGIDMRDTGTTGGAYIYFQNSAGNQSGIITHSGTTSITYTSTSDYRLKENVKTIENGLDRVLSLKPVTYTWIDTDNEQGEGFLAHELQEIVPLAVVGQKDELKEDGSIKPQSIDNSRIVPILVKAIQELNQQNQDLKSRLDKAGL